MQLSPGLHANKACLVLRKGDCGKFDLEINSILVTEFTSLFCGTDP